VKHFDILLLNLRTVSGMIALLRYHFLPAEKEREQDECLP
jgi:hypothetical protein